MSNKYYLANRISRIQYQREYRIRCKNYNTFGMSKVRKKYKKKPIPKTEFKKKTIVISFN